MLNEFTPLRDCIKYQHEAKLRGYCRTIIYISLVCILFTSCRTQSQISLINETNRIYTVRVCSLYLVDTAFKRKYFDLSFSDSPYLPVENDFLKLTKGSLDSCYEFQIKPNQEVQIYHGVKPPFEDGMCDLIGSIEIVSEDFYLKVKKEGVRELFKEVKKDWSFEYRIK